MRYLILFAISLSYLLVGSLTAGAQTPAFNKVQLSGEPVSILCLQYQDNNDWLRDLTITVKNVSPRNIFDLELTVILSGKASPQPILMPMRFLAANGTMGLPPGEQVTLTVAADDLEHAQFFLPAGPPAAAIVRADAILKYAYFRNSGWYKGAEYLQRADSILLTEPITACADLSLPPDGKSLSIITELAGEIPSEPLRIVGCQFGKGENWLKDLRVDLENISDHPISYLECLLIICNQRGGEYCVSIPIIFRGNPQLESTGGNGLLMPANQVSLRINSAAYEQALRLLKGQQAFYGLNDCDLIVGRVYYADDNWGWSNRSLLSNMNWERFSSSLLAYLIPKQNYIFGYLFNKEGVMTDITANRDKSRDNSVPEVALQPPPPTGRTISRTTITSNSRPFNPARNRPGRGNNGPRR